MTTKIRSPMRSTLRQTLELFGTTSADNLNHPKGIKYHLSGGKYDLKGSPEYLESGLEHLKGTPNNLESGKYNLSR